MKTLEELQAVRETYHNQLNLRREDHTRTRVIVAMDTCGIASGAKPVLMTFSDLIQEQNLTDRFCVLQSGCIGLCNMNRSCRSKSQESQRLPTSV